MITLNALDKAKEVGTSFMDSSKAFDTLKHNFITCHYGLSFIVINLVKSYLSERFQRNNVNNNSS